MDANWSTKTVLLADDYTTEFDYVIISVLAANFFFIGGAEQMMAAYWEVHPRPHLVAAVRGR